MPVVALTGNFGTGKTTVLQLFHKLGAHTFNIDDYVHDILEKPDIVRAMAKTLGSDILLKKGPDRLAINKKRVAGIIFNDPALRKAVEKIIHPEVLKKINQTKSALLNKDPSAFIIFEIPLLFEAGYDRHFDNIIVVHCRRSTAIKRLMNKGFSQEESARRMGAQLPLSEKMERAHYLIDNNDIIKETEKRVSLVMQKIAAARPVS